MSETISQVDSRIEAVNTVVSIEREWGGRFEDAPPSVIHEWTLARTVLANAYNSFVGRHEEELPGWLELAATQGVDPGIYSQETEQ